MNNGQSVEKIVHDKCGHKTLQVFYHADTDTYDGYCFRCGEIVAHPYGRDADPAARPKPKTSEEQQAEIDEITNELETHDLKDVPNRGLRKIALERFGVKMGLSPVNGTDLDTYYFPYTKGSDKIVKYKAGCFNVGEDGKKRMWSIGSERELDPFGWQQALAEADRYTIWVTEGEFDAIALWSIIMGKQHGTKYADKIPAVVSLPGGIASAVRDMQRFVPMFKKAGFKRIITVFDQDEAGEKGTIAVRKHFDVESANLPAKDANECFVRGLKDQAFAAVKFDAKVQKSSRLINANTLFEIAKAPPKFGLSWPKGWDEIQEATRGLRKGETIYIGAGQKMGKSEIVNTLGSHLIQEHNMKILMAKPEEANVKTTKLVAGKIAGKRFHDPKFPYDEADYDAACRIIDDRLLLIDLYQNIDKNSLFLDMKAAVAEGAEAIFIDPITNLTNGIDPAAANTLLQGFAQECSSLALDLDVIMFLFCHLRNPESGPEHTLGGRVRSSQFAGSRAMARSCNYMFGLEGNKEAEGSERNVRILRLLEDREFGETCEQNLMWDYDSTLFLPF